MVIHARQELGALIRSVRKSRDMKREVFAERCQVGEHIINRIERGKGYYKDDLLKLVIQHLDVKEQAILARMTGYLNVITHPPRRRLGPVFRKMSH